MIDRKRIVLALAAVIIIAGSTLSTAALTGPAHHQKQEVRQEKRTDKREARQDKRSDRREARQEHRGNRREAKQDRRSDRREARQDKKSNRREARQDRRDDRQETRHDWQEHRRDARHDRQEHRQDARLDRQEHRQDVREDRQEHRQEMRGKRREHRQEFWNNRLSKFDTNSDGQLSHDERIHARKAAKSHRQKLRQRIDKDRNGAITEVEWRAFSKRFGESDDDRHEQLARVKRSFDADSDGELSDSERGNAMRELYSRRIDMLEHFDADASGKLSKSERKRMKKFHKERAAQRHEKKD